MAFVDFIPPNHEQRGSTFNHFPTFSPDMVPHPLPPAPSTLNAGAPPPLYSTFPTAFCPHCQFNTNYTINGLCINCNLPIPAPAINHSLIQPIQHSTAICPPQPPGPVQPPRLQSHTYKDAAAASLVSGRSLCPAPPQPAILSGQAPPLQQPRAFGRNPKDRRDNSMDRFMMTSIIDVVNDVLEDTHDDDSTVIGLRRGQANALTVTLGPDGNMTPYPGPNSISLPLPPNKDGISGSLGPILQGKVKPQCQCGTDHSMLHTNTQDMFPLNCVPLNCVTSSYKFAPSAQDQDMLISPTGSLPSSRRTTPPQSTEPLPLLEEDKLDSCSKHPDEKLVYFCPTCVMLLCKNCAGIEHAHHNCLGLGEAFMHFKPNLDELLSKTRIEVDLLQYSLAETEKMSAKVSEKQKEAIGEVQKIFQAHREAVALREQELIRQINETTNMRINSLIKDQEVISQALDSVHSLSQTGEDLLRDSDPSNMLVAHCKLKNKLRSCRPFTSSRSPSEDDSFVLKTNAISIQSALKSLCLFTTAPYPPLCTVMGEGLYFPRVNKLCTVILASKDRAGEPCLEGGERLFVQLKSASGGGAMLPVDLRDNSDGTYSINFRPQLKGEHQLMIVIRGQHVLGSPFTLFVDSGREYGRFGVLTQMFGSEGSQNGQFCRPWGICCDQHGNIIVGDRSNHRIQVFDINGVFKHKFGGEGVRPGQFNRPAGVAVTREGQVVIADKDNHRIQVLKIDGTFLFMFGSKGGNDGQMIYPYDVAVNQFDGRIAVTDTGNHRLLIFSHDGILLGKFGYKGYLCGHFDSPRGIAFNDDGHIIVSDFNVHHILVIHPDGTTARILGCQGNGNGKFMRPQGIAVDHMGNFIVADTRNNRIVIMHRSGHFVAKFGGAGSAPGQFDRPTSVAVLPDGRVAVVDFGNSRIQIF